MKYIIVFLTGAGIDIIVESNGGTLLQAVAFAFAAGVILGVVDAVASRE